MANTASEWKTTGIVPALVEHPAPATTVYSYHLPEVRDIVAQLAADYPHQLFQANFDPGLDYLHEPVFEALIEQVRRDQQVTGLDQFPHRYPTSGSSEALFHLFARLKVEEPGSRFYQLQGDYQGYAAYADALKLNLRAVDEVELLQAPAGIVVCSQPSARDGNRLPRELLDGMLERHRVILDLAYLGMTDPLALDLAHPHIEAVVTSLSKPYGLYYHRAGFCFARKEIASLVGTRWFKNALTLAIAERVLRTLDPAMIRARYRIRQAAAIETMRRCGLRFDPAEVWLLASAPAEPPIPELEPFRRERFYRACLTPFLIHDEQQQARPICGKLAYGNWQLDHYRPGYAPCMLAAGHAGPCNPDAEPLRQPGPPVRRGSDCYRGAW